MVKVKVKYLLYHCFNQSDLRQKCFTISQLAADFRELMMSCRDMWMQAFCGGSCADAVFDIFVDVDAPLYFKHYHCC